MDVLVVNSQEEPFALTVVEGLASGTTVLATAVGGIPEMIKHRQNGWLVAARQNEELAEAIITLLHEPDLRARFGQNARQTAEGNFSTNRFTRDIDSFYSRLNCRPMQQLAHPLLDEKLATD
jgi:glycosyltransferase involved in cell wall biosynthesis